MHIKFHQDFQGKTKMQKGKSEGGVGGGGDGGSLPVDLFHDATTTKVNFFLSLLLVLSEWLNSLSTFILLHTRGSYTTFLHARASTSRKSNDIASERIEKALERLEWSAMLLKYVFCVVSQAKTALLQCMVCSFCSFTTNTAITTTTFYKLPFK